MKYSLTVNSDNPSEIAALIAFLNGSTAIKLDPSHPVFNQAPPAAAADDTAGDTPAAPGTLDKDGLPWDARIHSDPATMTTKGIWRKRKRRGLTDAEYATVSAELKARQAPQPTGYQPPPPMFDAGTPAPYNPGPAPVQTYQPPQAQPAPYQPTQAPDQQPQYQPQPVQTYTPAPAPAPTPAPAPAPQPAPTPAPAPQPTGDPTDFPSFMNALSTQMQRRDANGAAYIDAGYLAYVVPELNKAFGVALNAITDLSAHPQAAQIIPYAVGMMRSQQRWA